MAGSYLSSPTLLLPLADVDTAPIELRCPRCSGEWKPIASNHPPPDHVMLDACLRSTTAVGDITGDREDRRPIWDFCAAPCNRELTRRIPR